MKPMDERRLVSILKQEEADASSYYTSELAHKQSEFLDRYQGKPYGDEVEGMPKVVSQDVEDTVNSVMPHIMRMFLNPEDLISVEDDLANNIELEKQASRYLEHVFFKENDGKTALHDFVFDGLLQRIGIMSVCYEPPQKQPPKEYHGIAAERAQQFEQSPEYEVLEATANEPDELGVQTYDIKVQKTPRVGNFICEPVPPEEFAIANRSKSIEKADYHRRKQEVFLSDVMQLFPEKAEDLRSQVGIAADDENSDLDSDERRQSRFDDENFTEGDYSNLEERRKVDLITEWIRVDFDGDGAVELRQVKRVGGIVLENFEVTRSQLIEWSPIRVSHRAIGRSITDQIEELTKIKTHLMRFGIRNLEQVLSPRTFIRTNDPEVIDQMLDRDVGDVIKVDGDPRNVVHESVTPDVSPAVLTALQYYDQRVEQASGVMRHAQGNRDEGITDTADGIRRLQRAANARIELIGLWAQDGVERIFRTLLDDIVSHQDQPKMIRVSGKPMQIDPRGWGEDMTVTVNAGKAAETAEDTLQKLMIVSEKQEQIMQFSGPGNPIVGTEQYAQCLQDIVREGGFKTPERYFMQPPKGYDQQKAQELQENPQEDPKAQEAKARMQLEQMKAQQQAQLDKQKLDFEQQAAAREMQFKEQLAARDAQTQQTLQEMKLQSDMQLQDAKLNNEREIALLRIESEREIAMIRMEQERELAEQKAEDQKEIARSAMAARANGSSGYRPGGDLSK